MREPPRYDFRLEDLRAWHLVEASCRRCRHKATRDIVEKSASQFRIAKAWPVDDAPAFIINGRVPP
jgi:hypothetical protein